MSVTCKAWMYFKNTFELLLTQEYASLQVREPQIREGMKRVEPQTEDDLFPCTCRRKKVTRTGQCPSENWPIKSKSSFVPLGIQSGNKYLSSSGGLRTVQSTREADAEEGRWHGVRQKTQEPPPTQPLPPPARQSGGQPFCNTRVQITWHWNRFLQFEKYFHRHHVR